MIPYDKTATVYTEGAGGAFTVVAKVNLGCRLSTISGRGATTTVDRAELLAMRQLFWDPSYDMPECCQIEIDGVRWNPQPGTFVAPTRPIGGIIAYRACDVVRAG